MATQLEQLVAVASRLGGADPCQVHGHEWTSAAGRACQRTAEYAADCDCSGSQPVYECERCGDIDYGDGDRGPGEAYCDNKGREAYAALSL